MLNEIRQLSRAATAYVWMQVAYMGVGLGLIGITGIMLVVLYQTAKPLIGG